MSLAAFAESFFGLFNYWAVIVLMMIGLYTVLSHDNLVKKIIGLNVFQTSVFIFYISLGKIADSTAPILDGGDRIYAHPLPHVLILTAIVVGVAVTALGLALVIRIHEAYGSIEEDEILAADFESRERESALEDARFEEAEAEERAESEDHDYDDGLDDDQAHARNHRNAPR